MPAQTPKDFAKKGPLFKAYALHAQLSADAAHATIDSLQGRYIGRKHESGETVTTIAIEPPENIEESRETLYYLCWALFGVCVWASEILGDNQLNGTLQRMMDLL
jgi:hypothetical protein